MTLGPVFKQHVLDTCYEALQHEGFVRFRKMDVGLPLRNGFHCWVGLNSALRPDRFEINPFVGIHVVQIMKLYASLEGRKYDRRIATYARHMGELVPDSDENAFHFTPQTDVSAEARRLAKLYVNVGLPFAEAIADYDSLLPLLKERIDMLGGYPERVASCLYLMGRKKEAKAFVKKFLPVHRDYFEGFAEPFLKMLAAEETGEQNRIPADR